MNKDYDELFNKEDLDEIEIKKFCPKCDGLMIKWAYDESTWVCENCGLEIDEWLDEEA